MKLNFDEIFAVTAPGLEAVCAAELRDLPGIEPTVDAGGVRFAGGLRELYLANLHARVASRILVRIGEVRARDFSSLYNRCVKLPWGRFLKPDTPVQIRASSRSSRLVHTGRVAETISNAIDRVLGRDKPAPVVGGEPQLIVARMDGDVCRLSVDSSGALLHRRGFRQATAHAPMRETLAAGILRLLDWDGLAPLVDPMCGSGTFLIEAAQIAAHRAPGSLRRFAFMDWPRYRPGLWSLLLDEAARLSVTPAVAIRGSDVDPEAIAAASGNLGRAGCADWVSLACQSIDNVQAPPGTGLIVCNPPYGLRVGGDQDLASLYRRLGAVFRDRFAGWQGALLCPPGRLVAQTGLALEEVAALHNGGLQVSLFRAHL